MHRNPWYMKRACLVGIAAALVSGCGGSSGAPDQDDGIDTMPQGQYVGTWKAPDGSSGVARVSVKVAAQPAGYLTAENRKPMSIGSAWGPGGFNITVSDFQGKYSGGYTMETTIDGDRVKATFIKDFSGPEIRLDLKRATIQADHFGGHYLGKWHRSWGGTEGAIDLTIGSDRHVVGQMDSPDSAPIAIDTTLQPDGRLVFGGLDGYLSGDNHGLAGVFLENLGDFMAPWLIELSPAAGSGSYFVGPQYLGTWQAGGRSGQIHVAVPFVHDAEGWLADSSGTLWLHSTCDNGGTCFMRVEDSQGDLSGEYLLTAPTAEDHVTTTLLPKTGGAAISLTLDKPHPTIQSLVGIYTGSWSAGISGKAGKLDFTVNSAGGVTGTITHPDHGTGQLQGQVSGDGKITVNGLFGSAPLVLAMRGGLVPTEKGAIGTLAIDKGDFREPARVDLEKVPPPDDGP